MTLLYRRLDCQPRRLRSAIRGRFVDRRLGFSEIGCYEIGRSEFPMALDVYDPCPCGSGKKLKFCCSALVSEMDKVLRLQENNQSRMALQLLDGLQKKHPDNPWVLTALATILFEEGSPAEAKQVLRALLEAHSDHLLGTALFASASFAADGFTKSKPVILRAFQRCGRIFPDVMGSLAVGIAASMNALGHELATRRYLAMAMRLSHERDRQAIFIRLLQFDSNGDFSYPLRGSHELLPLPDVETPTDEMRNAYLLAEIGCLDPAGRTFAKSAVDENTFNVAQRAVLWHNAGLCRAWDGNESSAAEALHQAAKLFDDFHTAVDCETLAQLLDLKQGGHHVKLVQKKYRVKSVGRLLTDLDEQDRFVRGSLPKPQSDDASSDLPLGVYHVLDGQEPDEPATVMTDVADLPRITSQVSVFSDDAERPAEAMIVGIEGEQLDNDAKRLEDAAGDNLESIADEEYDDDPVLDEIPDEFVSMHRQWYFPKKTPGSVQKQLQRKIWDTFLSDTWPCAKVTGLHDKSPIEAADDPELKVPLAAAVNVLDSFCEQNRYSLDPKPVRSRLKLDAEEAIKIGEKTSLNTFSTLQLNRIDVESLSDRQLIQTLNRALLLHHNRFLESILSKVDSRPQCQAEVDMNRVYTTLTDICQEQCRPEEAAEWIEKGREMSKEAEDSFQLVLQWELRELALRMDEPTDPKLIPLLQQLWEYYGSKLPKLRQHLTELVATIDIQPPWETERSIVTAGSIAEAEVAADGTAQSVEKKLWLPGQKIE